MLFDLTWLKPGESFPPASEIARLQKYNDNCALFNGDIVPGFISKEEFETARKRIDRAVNNYKDMLCYPVDLNYHRLTSVKTADFVCGEKPVIKTAGKTDIDDMLDYTDFHLLLYTSIIDISRYGDAVARVYKTTDNKNTAVNVDPRGWIMIVDREDPRRIINHVIFWIVSREVSKGQIEYELHVQIHSKGSYIKRIYSVESKKNIDYTLGNGQRIVNFSRYVLGNQIGEDELIKTGLSDFAIVSLAGLRTSDDIYGKDDYEPIDCILAEIWARLGQIAIILDKHSAPDAYAPKGAYKQDAKGEWVLKTQQAHLVENGDILPGYITWEGQLVANFNHINMLIKELGKISEMGAVFDASDSTSNIAIDTMKAKFVSALKKAERVINNIAKPVKKIISLISEYGWKKIKVEDISIDWCDGLPNDEAREIANATALINSGMSTPKIENVERFGKTEERADEIEEAVNEHRANSVMSDYGNLNE